MASTCDAVPYAPHARDARPRRQCAARGDENARAWRPFQKSFGPRARARPARSTTSTGPERRARAPSPSSSRRSRRSTRRPSLFTPSVLEAPTRGRLSRKRRSRFERRAPGRVRTVVFSAPFDFAARPSPWRISSSRPSRAFGTALISLDVSGRGSPCPARWVRSRRSRWTCTACTRPYSRARCSRASV